MLRKILTRLDHDEDGTFGMITSEGVQECRTVERPWRNNEPLVSCIPVGLYRVEKYSSRKYPNVWEICGVPNRTQILFHNANWAWQLQGCVGVGAAFAVIKGKNGVTDSVRTLDRLRQIWPDEFELQVVESFRKGMVR